MARKNHANNEPSETFNIKTSSFTQHQRDLIKSIKRNDITVGIGRAGTGKTSATLYTAIGMLNNRDNPIEKIIYIRANVGLKGEKDLGTPPGDLKEKADHLSMPVRDNLAEFMGAGEINALFDFGKIEVTPIYNLRGRSLSRAFIVLDEAQNCTMHSLKTVVSRMGHDSKMVLIGDPDQVDIELRSRFGRFVYETSSIADRLVNGLDSPFLEDNPLSSAVLKACRVLKSSGILPILEHRFDIPFLSFVHKMETASNKLDANGSDFGIGIVYFKDVVRHGILSVVIDAL